MKQELTKKPELSGIDEPLEIPTPESRLIEKTIMGRSVADAARWFNEGLPENHPARVSRQAVWYWLWGSRPLEATVRAWKHFYGDKDPRGQLAVQILALREKEAIAA